MAESTKILSFLSLLQMSDSALPIGSYSHSWGLETFVQDERIKNYDQACAAINNLLRFSFAPREGTAAALAYKFERSPNRSGNRNSLSTINSYLSASLWTEETHAASINLGKRLQRLAESLNWCEAGNGPNASHHCVVVGSLGAKLGINLDDLIPAFLFAGTTAMVAALVKLVPLGHTDGQRILVHSQDLIAELSQKCANATVADIGGFSPLAEWASLEHQSLYSRLFQS